MQTSHRATPRTRVIVLNKVVVDTESFELLPVIALKKEAAVVTEHFGTNQKDIRKCGFDLFQVGFLSRILYGWENRAPSIEDLARCRICLQHRPAAERSYRSGEQVHETGPGNHCQQIQPGGFTEPSAQQVDSCKHHERSGNA